jgi:YVTN family beta-propeller protein
MSAPAGWVGVPHKGTMMHVKPGRTAALQHASSCHPRCLRPASGAAVRHRLHKIVVLGWGCVALAGCASNEEQASPPAASAAPSLAANVAKEANETPPSTTKASRKLVAEDGKDASQRRLTLVNKITGRSLHPKSIVHSGNGLFFAQNMMYGHNVTVLDRRGSVVARIEDRVNLRAFGVDPGQRSSEVRGSPVEAAFTSDGRFAYVSNYMMYGEGWEETADDKCRGKDWDPSFVYRIDTATFAIDQVIPVGAVPKFLAVTPDDTTLIVSNWCSLEASIVDVKTKAEKGRIEVGLHPRGIAVSSDSSVAYVSVMGAAKIVAIHLRDLTTSTIASAGPTPRHLVLAPDGKSLYVSNNLTGTVRAIDLATGKLRRSVHSGTQPRSMSISEDGTSLYVVNYEDNTLTKIATATMEVIQTLETGEHPVGITYDAPTQSVWVANYSGSLWVFEDR